MYKAIINSGDQFEIDSSDKNSIINDNPFEWDITHIEGDRYHIIYKGKSYKAELENADFESKTMTLKINGSNYEVELKDKFDLLLEKLGMNDLASSKVNDIKAPMPGLIFSIKIKEGDEVKKGDAIMILEAMKMENVLKSPGDGVVKAIKVKKGDSVEKNEVLVQF